MNEYAVAAMGEDRPGIVAAVTEALNGIGASIEDSSMTILGGHFAMLLLVQGEVGEDDVDAALRPVADGLHLMLEVRATAHHAHAGQRDDYVIAAYGPDRPGLVTTLAQVLAAEGVNITDFGSRLTEGGLFTMWFNVSVPAGVDVVALTDRLRDVGGEVALDVSVHHPDVESL